MANMDQNKELTSKIIGCAMKVHRTLGSGFQEVIYQRALAVEMEDAGLGFERELDIPIFYNQKQIGSRRVDFLVAGQILVELKAISKVEEIQLAQMINYLEAFKLPLGLLINFGEISLYFSRFVKTRKA